MFRHVQIRYKVLAVLLVPLAALTILSIVQLRDDVAAGRQAARVNRLTGFAGTVTQLAHALQSERDLSLGYLSGGRTADRQAIGAARGRVDNAIDDFNADLASLEIDPSDRLLLEQLADVRELLALLDDQRGGVDEGEVTPTTLTGTRLYYGDVIVALLDVNSGIPAESDDRELVRQASTFALLSRIKEFASQERNLVYSVLSANVFGEGQLQRLQSIIGTKDQLIRQFQRSATRDERKRYAASLLSTNRPKLADLRRAMLAGGDGGPVGGAAYSSAEGVASALEILTTEVDQLREVEVGLADQLSLASRARQSEAREQALFDGGLTLLVLALAVAVSLLMAQSMARPLLRLARAAHEVAERRLPEAVDRMHRGEPLDRAAGAPLDITSRDETGQVARAFNSVHQVAVRVAGEQAALRKSIGDMFLNLARRSQGLIDRLLEQIEELEEDASDETSLSRLFRADHLATRLRRNAEDLIVLSGAEPPRRWSQPIPLGDVVRAAIGEVEDYQRVELLAIHDLGLAGHAVADTIHLLAELIENATSFSPPVTRVELAGQQVGGGYVLEIEDRGIGMSDEELAQANNRLATAPAIDLALSRMLGLYVVGRLALRHGIKVQLRHSWYGGITALVLLPSVLLAEPADRGASQPRPLPPRPAERDPLPIFEATRSEWFDGDLARVHLPLRRHAASGNANANTGARPAGMRAATAPPQQLPPGHGAPYAPYSGPPPPEPAAPERAAPGPGLPDGGTVPGPPEPDPNRSVLPSRGGLPRRIPSASLAPGLAATPPQPEPPQDSSRPRSPQEIRAMLSTYRSGLERGRHMAAGPESEGGGQGWPDGNA